MMGVCICGLGVLSGAHRRFNNDEISQSRVAVLGQWLEIAKGSSRDGGTNVVHSTATIL